MFAEMRSAVHIPKSEDILDYIHAMPEAQQQGAFTKIQDIERKAMAEQVPQAGLVSLLEFLDEHKIKKAICTRNFDHPVEHFTSQHVPGHVRKFEPIVTRGFRPPKPSPAGILHIAHAWGVVERAEVPESPQTERPLPVMMVGDSIDDIVAGYEAGALTVLLKSEGKEELERDERVDIAVSRYVVRPGMVLKAQADFI
jgi:phosphoglycolate phosphatase-like HAD superfamily hydrolase